MLDICTLDLSGNYKIKSHVNLLLHNYVAFFVYFDCVSKKYYLF